MTLAFSVPAETVLIGAITGLVYGVLAVGILLIYRATRVINFAHGELGAVGAAVLAKLVLDRGWNFFVAFALVTLLGGVIGALVDLTIVRPLFDRPRIVVLVATIGIAQLLLVLQALLPGVDRPARYPTGVDLTIHLAGVVLRGEHVIAIVAVPTIVAALTLFLTRSPFGIAMRAAAENPDAARLAGVNVRRVSTVVWVIAGMLATATVVLVDPIRGTIVGLPTVALGPGLLLRALAAALVGRFESLPATLLGGVGIGVIEAVAFVNVRSPGTVDAIVFAVVLLLVLTRAKGGDDEPGGWTTTTPRPRLRRHHNASRPWRRARGAVLALAAAGLAPLVFTTAERQFLLTRVVVYALAGLSVVIITSWAGHLSLAQFAFVGLGSMATAGLVARGMSFSVAVIYAVIAGCLAAVIVGAPALRVRGLFLGVTTLGFAVAARGWLFTSPVFLGRDSTAFVSRGSLFGIGLADERTYYYLCLAALLTVTVLVRRLRQTGAGRVILAVRDNEDAASAMTVSPAAAKLAAFALSGAIAAFAGALLAGLRVQFGASDFGPEESLRLVSMTIIGGIGSVWGPLLGALYVLGLPALVKDSLEVQLLTSGIGVTAVLLFVPGGLVELGRRLTDRLRTRAANIAPPSPALDAQVRPRFAEVITRPRVAKPSGEHNPALQINNATVRFEGLTAVDDVTLALEPGETLGLIGTNGAGKSTMMNAISGFLPLSGGSILLWGDDVSALRPHQRAALGLGRVFQDARMFPELSVHETLQVALEAEAASELIPSLFALPPSRRVERAKRQRADELIDFLGLGDYTDTRVAELSTGTRRIVELAALLAGRADVLLLDEPTAGVAQREAEAFGQLLGEVRGELGTTMLIIEHDMPMILSLSDRVVCMSAGQVIANGPPEDIRKDPEVIAAYLGTDRRAIERSDAAPHARVRRGAARGAR